MHCIQSDVVNPDCQLAINYISISVSFGAHAISLIINATCAKCFHLRCSHCVAFIATFSFWCELNLNLTTTWNRHNFKHSKTMWIFIYNEKKECANLRRQQQWPSHSAKRLQKYDTLVQLSRVDWTMLQTCPRTFRDPSKRGTHNVVRMRMRNEFVRMRRCWLVIYFDWNIFSQYYHTFRGWTFSGEFLDVNCAWLRIVFW